MKKVGVVAVTYRNSEDNSVARLYGLVSLVEQMLLGQTYQGDVKMALIDSSPEPHPFFEALGEKLADKLIYMHVPSRQDIPTKAYDNFPEARQFIPTPEEQESSEFWQERRREVAAANRYVPYEESYPIQPDIEAQFLADRPTIGMKKNFGIRALEEAFGAYDVIVMADDDDHHGPDYIEKCVAGLGEADFGRMTDYLVHALGSAASQAKWGRYNTPIERGAIGNWDIPDAVKSETLYEYRAGGEIVERPLGAFMNRVIPLAWPAIIYEGALHCYSTAAWKRSVDTFGGVAPVSFSEDVIYGRRNFVEFGANFKAKNIPTDGQQHFLRCTDGSNASVIYYTGAIEQSDVPEWANKALAPLNRALSRPQDFDHSAFLSGLACKYQSAAKTIFPERLKVSATPLQQHTRDK